MWLTNKSREFPRQNHCIFTIPFSNNRWTNVLEELSSTLRNVCFQRFAVLYRDNYKGRIHIYYCFVKHCRKTFQNYVKNTSNSLVMDIGSCSRSAHGTKKLERESIKVVMCETNLKFWSTKMLTKTRKAEKPNWEFWVGWIIVLCVCHVVSIY